MSGSKRDDDFGAPDGGWLHVTAAHLAHYGDTIPAEAFEGRHDLRSVIFPASTNIMIILMIL